MPAGYKKDGTPSNPSGRGGFGERPEDINRLGVTSEARRAMHAAAEAAALAQERMLEALLDDAMSRGTSAEVVAMIAPQINTLIKNAIDRIEGTPKASVDLSSEDGSMTPKPNRIELVAPSDDDDSSD